MRTAAFVLFACGVAAADEPSAPQLFKRGVESLRSQDYAAAAAAFQQSYALSPKAATVCNLALTYDRWGGHVAEAIESYRKCAEDDASGRFRDHALERARALRAQQAAATPTTPPPVTEPPRTEAPRTTPPPVTEPPRTEAPPVAPPPTVTPPPPPPPVAPTTTPPPPIAGSTPPAPELTRPRPFFKDPAACVLTALGVAGVGTGVGLLVAGKLADNQIATTSDLGQKSSLYDRAGTLQPAGVITLGVGVALVVAGVIEWAAHGRHQPRARAARDGWSF